MKIEVGKFYKTVDGKKVRIYSTNSESGFYPIHGAVYMGKLIGWSIQSWKKDGRHSHSYYISNDFDIVGEWKESLDFDWDCLPTWADRFIAMDSGGLWFSYDAEPVIAEWVEEYWGKSYTVLLDEN